MVSEYLGLDRNAGLTTALVGAADVNDLLQPWGDDSLYVLASGQIPPNPSELLGSDEMRTLILRLEQAFDTVVIDAPPLLPVTDAAVLSQHVGGVVLVVGSRKLRHQDLEKSLNSMQMVGANILGVLLNRLPTNGPDAYSYSYYSHEDEHQTRGKAQPGKMKERARTLVDTRREATNNDVFKQTLLEDSAQAPHIFPTERFNRT
jgi:Mrp family chromosome partitioning ATPase